MENYKININYLFCKLEELYLDINPNKCMNKIGYFKENKIKLTTYLLSQKNF